MGLAYTFLGMGDAELDPTRGPLAGTLSGDDKTNYVNFVNVNLIWKF